MACSHLSDGHSCYTVGMFRWVPHVPAHAGVYTVSDERKLSLQRQRYCIFKTKDHKHKQNSLKKTSPTATPIVSVIASLLELLDH